MNYGQSFPYKLAALPFTDETVTMGPNQTKPGVPLRPIAVASSE